MSLSGEYLQELSTRYKKQVDDMQHTILDLIEENRLKTEKDLKMLGEMKILSEQVASLQSSLYCLKTETENLNLVINYINYNSFQIYIFNNFICTIIIYLFIVLSYIS